MTANNISEAAVAWAQKRGISRETLDRFGAGSGMAYFPGSEHQGKLEAIFFPYSRQGAVVNWKARALASKDFAQKSGGEQRFFNLDAVLAGPMEVVFITEGEPDALALSEAGLAQHEILSVPNGAPDKPTENPEQTAKYQYVIEGLKEGLARCKRFVLATDADEAGRALRQDLVHLLGPARCQFVDWPAGLKDANAMLARDGAQGLGEFIGEAPKDWPVEGLYGLHDLPEPPALTLWRPGFPEWESRIAFAPTTLSIATGEPGHGKTTLMSQVWFQICRNYDLTAVIASFETRAKPHHRRNIRQFFHGRRDFDLTDAERKQADDWNDAHFKWLVHPNRRATLKWILDMAEVAVVRHNARILQIDPWNRLESARPGDTRETDYIGQCLDELLDFAADMNVHVQVVVHPAKSQERTRRRGYVELDDIAGSKHWNNRADLGLSVYRPKLFDDGGKRCTEAQLILLKARYEELGHPTTFALDFDLKSGRYRPIDYETKTDQLLRS